MLVWKLLFLVDIMKLVIDRGSTKKGYYLFSFGVDYDISIFEEEIGMTGVDKEVMSEIDKIITGSVELKFCVLHLKHPLLLEELNEKTDIHSFFSFGLAKNILREYFALRLIHRRYTVELIEIGKRLF
jgi:hypothetical protein